ncbi:FecR family protein [Paenibacillus taihuensis]|nr:FecR family protein [Paenibacillus taihuensis]
MLLCLLLIIGPCSLLAGEGHASAQVMRVAVVKEISGTVNVLKSGGAKSFKAFRNMSLNEGDQIATGKDGEVTLSLSSSAADQDEISISTGSQVTFSKMKDSGGAKTKMSVWAGSLWVKVKSVSNASDQFEVETPTSIMGVRGTHFFVKVNPITGKTEVFLAAGVVESTTTKDRHATGDNSDMPNSVTIYPSQQLGEADGDEGLETSVSVVDLSTFVSQASPDLVKAILKDAASIAAEQKQMLDKAKESIGSEPNKDNFGGQIQSPEDLERMVNNLNNLVSIIAKEAIDQKKVAQDVIDQINKESGKKLIDSSTKSELILSEKEKKQQELAAKFEEAQKKAADKKAQEQQQLQQAIQDAIKKAQELRDQQEQANKEALKKQQDQANQTYYNQLTAEEKKRIDENRVSAGLPSIPTKDNTSSGSGSVVSKPTVSLLNNGRSANGVLEGYIDLGLAFKGFTGSNKIMGYQLEVEYDNTKAQFGNSDFDMDPLYYRAGAAGFIVEPESAGTVPGANSVDDYRVVQGTGNTSTLFYSVVKFNGSSVEINGETTLVRLPFLVSAQSYIAGSITFKIKSITAVDENGNPVEVVKGSDITLQVIPRIV